MAIIYTILGILFFAHTPIIPIIRVLQFDIPDKASLVRCILEAWIKNILTIIPDILSPIIVPVALLFTKWEDEHLPKIFKWWDNDASINGDKRTDNPNDGLGGWTLKPVPLEKDSKEAVEMCYWAKGHHPRSFYARWVWLGLRNRASGLSQLLGTSIESTNMEKWSGPGWYINRIGNIWRYFELLKVGPVLIRMHCGYKIPKLPGESKAHVVSIGFSLRKGP